MLLRKRTFDKTVQQKSTVSAHSSSKVTQSYKGLCIPNADGSTGVKAAKLLNGSAFGGFLKLPTQHILQLLYIFKATGSTEVKAAKPLNRSAFDGFHNFVSNLKLLAQHILQFL